jgi:hypothetical protein
MDEVWRVAIQTGCCCDCYLQVLKIRIKDLWAEDWFCSLQLFFGSCCTWTAQTCENTSKRLC